MRKSVVLGLAVLFAVLLGAAEPVRADRDWAIGKWRIRQSFSEHHKETVFEGRLSIHREGHSFTGRIYFNAVGRWEALEDVHVSDDSIRFFRPEHPQEFRGRRTERGIEGTWQDRQRRGKEWSWKARRE
jgi:hypothetical protein